MIDPLRVGLVAESLKSEGVCKSRDNGANGSLREGVVSSFAIITASFMIQPF
jgi:hypothetical protein